MGANAFLRVASCVALGFFFKERVDELEYIIDVILDALRVTRRRKKAGVYARCRRRRFEDSDGRRRHRRSSRRLRTAASIGGNKTEPQ